MLTHSTAPTSTSRPSYLSLVPSTTPAAQVDAAPTAAQIAEHMHLVHGIVAQFVRKLPRSVQREDLVAAGTLGLFHALRSNGRAAEKSATCEEMFVGYARIRIRGSILDELRRHDWSPRRRRNAVSTAPAPVSMIPPGSAAAPTSVVVPAMPALPVTVVGFDDLSPQAMGRIEGGSTDIGAGFGTSPTSPFAAFETKRSNEKLNAALATLPERERTILTMRYFEEIPSKSIASALGLSEARISQLHARATARLRALLAVEGGEVEQAA